MRVLIISHAFPPYNTIGSVRVGKTAKYLNEMGHEVRVITTRQSGPNDLPIEIPLEKIVYTRWININRPKELFKKGKKNNNAGTIAIKIEKSDFIEKLWYIYRALLNFPDEAIGWIPYVPFAASAIIRSWIPDLIFASAMPYTSLLIARKISDHYNIPWVAELRDLWVDNHYYPYPKLRRWLDQRLEKSTLSTATGLVTVSEPLAAVLRRKYNKPTAVILNGFDSEDYTPSTVPNDEMLHIVYTGSIYKDKRDPSPLFEALQILGADANKIRVVFYGFGRYIFLINRIAEEFKVSHLIVVRNHVSYRESLKQQAEADILLLLLWDDPKEEGVYTGKLFEYIGTRRPILVIGSKNNVAAHLIRERKAGIVLNDPIKIADQLRIWLQEKQSGGIAAIDQKSTTGLSRREQTCKLIEFFQSLLRNYRPGRKHVRI